MVDRNLRSSDQRNVQVPGSVCLFFRKKGGVTADWKSLGNIVSSEFDAVIEKLDHFSVRRGLRAKDKTVITERNASMNFVFDEINRHNLEFAFGSPIDSVAAAAELRTKHEGIFNGTTLAAPQTIDIGVTDGDILSLIVRDPNIEGAPVTYVTPADYTFDVPTGVLTTVAVGALDPIPLDGDLHIFIEKVVGTEKHEIHEGTEIEGEAQFQVLTPGGAQFAAVFPNVVMRNNGAIAIGDGTAWMEVPMTLEILVDVLGKLGTIHVINEADAF